MAKRGEPGEPIHTSCSANFLYSYAVKDSNLGKSATLFQAGLFHVDDGKFRKFPTNMPPSQTHLQNHSSGLCSQVILGWKSI